MAEAALKQDQISNQPDDEAVVAVNLNKIRAAQDNAASHHGSLRSTLKHAEEKGINLKAAKRALAIIKSGEADAWLEETRETTRYLRILRHGITESQLRLDFGTTLEPMEEKAALDGRAAGFDMTSTEADNPHELNTQCGQAWLASFRQARSERDTILSMQAEDEEGGED